MKAKEIAAIMATYEYGQQWEYRLVRGGDWMTCEFEPAWSWCNYEYRRKPTPKTRTRPMVFDELPAVGTIVRFKTMECLITSKQAQDDSVYCGMCYVKTDDLNRWERFAPTGCWLPFTITETIYE